MINPDNIEIKPNTKYGDDEVKVYIKVKNNKNTYEIRGTSAKMAMINLTGVQLDKKVLQRCNIKNIVRIEFEPF